LEPSYDAFVAPATSRFKNVMPRVAALLDVMQVSEIIKVVSADTFERPIYAGNADPDREIERRQEGHHGADLDLRRGR
jgi:electron transfer flavoprotein alpha subunit